MKGILPAVVIVACLALLGFLVHEKVEGSVIAAMAAVTTIIAWVTRTPNSKDPPTAGHLVVVAGIGTIVATTIMGCGSWFSSYEDVSDPNDDAKYARCHVQARADKQITGDPELAWRNYKACKADAGVP